MREEALAFIVLKMMNFIKTFETDDKKQFIE